MTRHTLRITLTLSDIAFALDPRYITNVELVPVTGSLREPSHEPGYQLIERLVREKGGLTVKDLRDEFERLGRARVSVNSALTTAKEKKLVKKNGRLVITIPTIRGLSPAAKLKEELIDHD